MNNAILFSIIIPTYNRAGFIIKTLESIIGQNYSKYEVLIIDDGSTDNTREVINTFIKKNNLHQFNYFFKKNEERAAARNYGVFLAKGKYINFVDSDDYLLFNHLDEAYNVIKNYNEPEVFHLNYAWATSDLQIIKANRINSIYANNILVYGNVLSCNGVFLRKDIAIIHKFNENKYLSATEDWELWLRLGARYNIQMFPTITSYIIDHSSRSVYDFNLIKLNARKNALITSIKNDLIFLKKYPNGIRSINYQMDSYIALHAALCNKKLIAIKYLIISILYNLRGIFKLRTYIILYKIIFKK